MVRWAVGDGWGAGWGAGWVEAAGALDSLHALACPKHPICLWHRGKTRSFSCQSCLCKHLKARVVPVRGVSIGGAPVPPRARAQRRCTRRRHVLHPPLFHHVSNHIFPLMHACFFHFLEQEMTRAAAQAQEKREREQRWEREAAQRAETMERLINFKSAPRAAPAAPHLVDSLRIDQPHAMRSLTEGRTEGSPEAETGVGGGRGGGKGGNPRCVARSRLHRRRAHLRRDAHLDAHLGSAPAGGGPRDGRRVRVQRGSGECDGGVARGCGIPEAFGRGSGVAIGIARRRECRGG